MGLFDIEAVAGSLRCGLSWRVYLLTTRTAEGTMFSRCVSRLVFAMSAGWLNRLSLTPRCCERPRADPSG